MKRKGPRCAAAHDDDFADFSDAQPTERKERGTSRSAASPERGDGAAPAGDGDRSKKREKECAWMDSDDEGEEKDGSAGAEVSSPSRKRSSRKQGS